MESRAAFRGTGISKWLMALLALIVALGLSVMAGYLARSVSAPAGTQTNSVTTESGPTCPLSDCNLRSVGSPEAAPTVTEPAYSFDPSVYELVP